MHKNYPKIKSIKWKCDYLGLNKLNLNKKRIVKTDMKFCIHFDHGIYEILVLVRPNRPKLPLARQKDATQILSTPLSWVAPEPPVRDLSRSGKYLSWVADFTLG